MRRLLCWLLGHRMVDVGRYTVHSTPPRRGVMRACARCTLPLTWVDDA